MNGQGSIRISVVMSVRDAAKYVNVSVKGILRQLDQKDELVIVDDGSSDSTYVKLKQWEQSDSRIHLIKNSGDGLVSALNLGISNSSNSWIARADVDDVYPIERLEVQRSFLKTNVVAVFSDYSLLGDNSKKLGFIPSGINHLAVHNSLILGQRTPHPVALFSKEAFHSVGKYREQDFLAEDYSLWLRMAKVGDLISVPRNLLQYQLHGNSISARRRNDMLTMRDRIRKQFFPNLGLLDSLNEKLPEILEDYSNHPHNHRRSLLLFREFITHCLMVDAHLSQHSFYKKYWTAAFNPLIVHEVLKMNYDRTARKRYRQLSPNA